ncbi:MAG TPA: hypothetical protein VHA56_02710 [Mucilaginibacter sp.]|nr:hypothetical protein [Mucilaginibacter sp.]
MRFPKATGFETGAGINYGAAAGNGGVSANSRVVLHVVFMDGPEKKAGSHGGRYEQGSNNESAINPAPIASDRFGDSNGELPKYINEDGTPLKADGLLGPAY